MNTTTTVTTSTTYNDTPSSIPSHPHTHAAAFDPLKRYLLSVSTRKVLRNLRLLILVLAFATLILDAITLSFEVNVMNLDLAQSQVATQAALLLTPDLMAMTMVVVLLLRDCFGRSPSSNTRRQKYEGATDRESREDEKRRESVKRQEEQQQQQEEDEKEEIEGVRQTRELHQEGGGGPHRQYLDNSAEYPRPSMGLYKGQQQMSFNFPGKHEHAHVQQQQEHRLDHTYNNHNNTQEPTLITSADGVDGAYGTESAERAEGAEGIQAEASSFDKRSSPHLSSSSTLSLPLTLSTTKEKRMTKRPRKSKRWIKRGFYVVFRLIFSLGLAVLALYWPVSKRKPPLGYLPNLTEPSQQQGGSSNIVDRTPSSFHPYGNNTGSRIGNRSLNIRAVPSGLAGFGEPQPSTEVVVREDKESAGSTHNGGPGGPGGGGHRPPNLRPGGPGVGGYGSYWCSLEEAFGDNQSAVVYCRVKDVRPVMTYIWASFVLLELCVAYLAGDFALNRTRTRRAAEGKLDACYDAEEMAADGSGSSGAGSATVALDGDEQPRPQPRPRQGHSGISITVTDTDAPAAGAGVGQGTMLRDHQRG